MTLILLGHLFGCDGAGFSVFASQVFVATNHGSAISDALAVPTIGKIASIYIPSRCLINPLLSGAKRFLHSFRPSLCVVLPK